MKTTATKTARAMQVSRTTKTVRASVPTVFLVTLIRSRTYFSGHNEYREVSGILYDGSTEEQRVFLRMLGTTEDTRLCIDMSLPEKATVKARRDLQMLNEFTLVSMSNLPLPFQVVGQGMVEIFQ